jgi:hypothetical protein
LLIGRENPLQAGFRLHFEHQIEFYHFYWDFDFEEMPAAPARLFLREHFINPLFSVTANLARQVEALKRMMAAREDEFAVIAESAAVSPAIRARIARNRFTLTNFEKQALTQFSPSERDWQSPILFSAPSLPSLLYKRCVAVTETAGSIPLNNSPLPSMLSFSASSTPSQPAAAAASLSPLSAPTTSQTLPMESTPDFSLPAGSTPAPATPPSPQQADVNWRNYQPSERELARRAEREAKITRVKPVETDRTKKRQRFV